MNLEKLMYRNVPLWVVFSLVLSSLALIIVFGALVAYALEGGKRLQALTSPALAIANIPVNGVKWLNAPSEPVTAERREGFPDGFWRNPNTPFVDDGYALIPHYTRTLRRYVVDLIRLSDGGIVREYAPDIADINRRSHIAAAIDLDTNYSPNKYQPNHPLLMPDGGLVFHDETPEVRIDVCGKVTWTLDGVFHHSNEVGPDGNIWTPERLLKSSLPHVGPHFREDRISEISPDGRLVRAESSQAILARNRLSYLWRSRPYSDDPTHTNDIQPVMHSGRYWQAGDLFISMRHLALVLLYRPSTGRVLWWREGPWSMQHDINVIDDHRISVFDNGVEAGPGGANATVANGDYVVNHNRVYVYDFATGKVDSPFEGAFAQQDIRTITEGRGTPMDNGDVFVEETNYGRLQRMSGDGTVRWRYMSTDGKGRGYELGWSRYLDPKRNAAGIRAAATARCG